MQLLSAAMDLLMFFASCSRMPSLPVLLSRSLPARSTIVSSAFLQNRFFKSLVPDGSCHFCSKNIQRTACDLELDLFIPVWFTARFFIPLATYCSSCSFVLMWIYVRPCTNIPVLGSSLIYKFCKLAVDGFYDDQRKGDKLLWLEFPGSSRSVICSIQISRKLIVTLNWALLGFYLIYSNIWCTVRGITPDQYVRSVLGLLPKIV